MRAVGAAAPVEGVDRTAVAGALRAGATVLTPNRRLARALKAGFDRSQQQAGLQVWPSADVLPWDAWIVRSLQQAPDPDTHLLSPLQESVLWREVIGASTVGADLLSEATVRTAQEAWRRLHDYQLEQRIRELGATVDQRVFREWAIECTRRVAALGAVTPAQVPALLQQRIEQGWRPTAPLVLAGFDPLTPRQHTLLEALRRADVRIEQPVAPLQPRPMRALAFTDARAQWRAAAAWARARLAADPALRIGLVVPDLEAQRSVLSHALAEALVPDQVIAADDDAPRPFNLSLGARLAHRPLVACALGLHSVLCGAQPLAEVGALLLSPFLGDAQREAGRRARLDRSLREMGLAQLDLARLRRLADRVGGQGAPHGDAAPLLGARLARVLARRDSWRRGRPSEWAERFFAGLADLGFPGDRPLASGEYQTHQRLRELLASLSSLDRVLGPLALAEAVALVRRLAGDIVFQPESPDVPVQVLGVLEAQHLQFDALWIAQMTDEHWPGAPNPNPLLPLAWQHAAGMPGATADLALAQAARSLQRLAASADEIVLSYPQREADRALSPSALLRDVALVDAAALGIAPAAPLMRALRTPVALQSTRDSIGPPLTPPAGAALAVGGGTRLFKDQAACAFRAFAAHRLRARELPEPEVGLSAADRGRLLHATMAQLWGGLRSHAQLLAANTEELQARALTAAQAAIGTLLRERPELNAPRALELETRRLVRTAVSWLDLERQRPPFEVVAVEQRMVVQLPDLRLEATPDRIDRLADGGVLIIDYKSTAPGIGAWLGERPDEPQLPLYAIGAATDVAGIAFAQLQPGKFEFKALVAPGVRLPGRTTEGDAKHPAGWPGLLRDWQAELQRLARAYLSGAADVAPKRRTSCDLCPQPVFCRLEQRRSEADRLVGGNGADEEGGA